MCVCVCVWVSYGVPDLTTSLPVRHHRAAAVAVASQQQSKLGKSPTAESGSANTRLSLPPIDDDQLFRPRYVHILHTGGR